MVKVVKLFRIVPVNAFRRHGIRAFFSKAWPRMHAVQEKTVNSRCFKDFARHGDGMVTISCIVTHLAEETVQTILLIGAAIRIHDEPIAMAKPFFMGEAKIHIGRQFDAAGVACIRQFLQKIVCQRRMTDADFRVVIRHAKIAAGGKHDILDACLLKTIRNRLEIKRFPNVWIRRHRMEIKEQTPFWK